MNINEAASYKIPKPHSGISRLAENAVRNKTAAGGEKQTLQVDSKLIDRLTKTQLETRSELIGDIKARIQNGEFLTRSAAESVADSILGF